MIKAHSWQIRIYSPESNLKDVSHSTDWFYNENTGKMVSIQNELFNENKKVAVDRHSE